MMPAISELLGSAAIMAIVLGGFWALGVWVEGMNNTRRKVETRRYEEAMRLWRGNRHDNDL
jgi:hypothetical protein